MKRNLLLTPGPTQIPPQICAALGKPIIHHRTPQFQENLKEANEGLKYFFQTKNDVLLLTCSGTGAMEAAVSNLVSPGDKVIAVDGGKFGERWVELCQTFGAKTHVIKVEWGKAVTAAQIKEVLDKEKDVKAVFVTLSETSTGVTTDVQAVAQVVQKTNTVLVVDAISALGIIDIQMDAWGVDMVISAGHKGFMLPPGIAFLSANDKAWKAISACKTPRYYFDLKVAKEAAAKTDTPYTPAIGIIIALVESLKMMREIGREKLFARYARLAQGVKEAAKALGLSIFPESICQSNVLTAINLPSEIDGEKLVKTMRDTYGISVAGGQDKLKGKIVRIGHMGCLDEFDILTCLACFEKVLFEMGYKFNLGAGLSGAQKIFNQK